MPPHTPTFRWTAYLKQPGGCVHWGSKRSPVMPSPQTMASSAKTTTAIPRAISKRRRATNLGSAHRNAQALSVGEPTVGNIGRTPHYQTPTYPVDNPAHKITEVS